MSTSFRVTSYNSYGLGAGHIEFIEILAGWNELTLVQETWLLAKNANLLGERIKSHDGHGISGMEDGKLVNGRPHGGCANVA